jgi:TolB-like protein
LKPDDNPDKNLNKTFYRDQVNKVANVVKEIIYGLHPDEKRRITKSYPGKLQLDFFENVKQSDAKKFSTPKKLTGRFIIPFLLGLLFIVALFLIIPRLIPAFRKQPAGDEKIKKAIAVMPVLNFTGNAKLDWIADMIQNDLTGQLQGINNLIVRPRQTTLQFRSSNESVKSIAQKLGAEHLIESSIKGTEDKLVVEIRVVEAFPEEKF